MYSVVAWFAAVFFGLWSIGLVAAGAIFHTWQSFVGAAAMAVMAGGWVMLARHWAHSEGGRVLYDTRSMWVMGIMLLALVVGGLTMSTLG